MDFLYDFYQVEPVKGKRLSDALVAIAAKKAKDRYGDVGDQTYRVSHLAKDQKSQLWTGDIVKIRMTNLPGIGDATSDAIRDIPLQDYEGVTECACFALSEPDQVLILQRNRLAIGEHRVAPLFREISGVDVPWVAAPIPRADAVAELEGASQVNHLVVRFARVRAPELIVSDSDGDKTAIKVSTQGVVPTLKMELSNGRGRNAEKLNLKSMIGFAKRAFAMASGQDPSAVVEDVRIKGLDSVGAILDMHLLDFQLSFRGVASKAKTRRISYSARKGFAEDAFEKLIKQARFIIQGIAEGPNDD